MCLYEKTLVSMEEGIEEETLAPCGVTVCPGTMQMGGTWRGICAQDGVSLHLNFLFVFSSSQSCSWSVMVAVGEGHTYIYIGDAGGQRVWEEGKDGEGAGWWW